MPLLTEEGTTNREIEVRLLATLFQEKESRKQIKRLFPQVFANEGNKSFFKIMADMELYGKPFEVDYILANYNGKVSPVDLGVLYMTTRPYDRESFMWAISHLKEMYFARLSLNVSNKIALASQKLDGKRVVDLGNTLSRSYSAVFRAENASRNHFEESVDMANSPLEFIPTSFPRLNALIGGWTKSDLSSIGGKAGHHKTTFTVYDMIESIKRGYCQKVLYFAIDEPGEKIARRIIAHDLNISLDAMRQKQVVLDKKEIADALTKIYKDKLIIVDTQFSAEEIQRTIIEERPSRAIIDHIQELDYGNEGISDQKVMVASKRFKEAARISKCNVTIISQVRDKLIDERFEDKIPRAHDFLYASDLRRKSRELSVVYWKYKDSQADSDFPFFDFIVWKSTYSGTGRVRFLVDPDKARFADKESSKNQFQTPQSEQDIWANISKIGT